MFQGAGGDRALRGSDPSLTRERVARRPVSSLRRLSEALGAVDDVLDVAAAAADWIHGTFGPLTVVSLAHPDGSGRLRVVWSDGGTLGDPRRRAAGRRAAFRSLTPTRLDRDGDDRVEAILPLVSRSEALGVLEVLAPVREIDAAWDLLEVGASQLGAALRAITRNARLRREVEALERSCSLVTALVGAGTAHEAVRIAIRFVWERFRVPVAGWCDAEGDALRLVGTHGLGPRRSSELRLAMPAVATWGSAGPADRERLTRRFGDLAGARRVSVLDAGHAVVLCAEPDASRGSLTAAGSLLTEVLRLLAHATLAERRNERLDMGIAWTAHELRSPLLGIRAALELLLERGTSDPTEHAVLRTSLHELDQLAGSAEAILTWAMGERQLRRRPADLVRIVEEAVGSCRLEKGDRDVVVFAPERAVGRFDPVQLRTAVSNLVRNAVAYSYPGTKVEVVVEETVDGLALSVKDEGPEIPASERRLIFDPFARGSGSVSARNGTGLGLFIARRVVEAHGGRIWVESDPGGTTFHVRLPVEGRDLQRFAS